jgi:hypothetical protein
MTSCRKLHFGKKKPGTMGRAFGHDDVGRLELVVRAAAQDIVAQTIADGVTPKKRARRDGRALSSSRYGSRQNL